VGSRAEKLHFVLVTTKARAQMAGRVNTVVVGASAAGRSTSHCLEKLGVEHVLLEKQQQVASPA
jgi:cation diffusion facilitator CzcD-associated flavoprotein CzcO